MCDFKAFLAGTGLSALLLGMGGCDSSPRVQEPPEAKPRIGATDLSGSSEFDRELIAAKSAIADPAQREHAMTAILDKYGVAHPPASGSPLEAAPVLPPAAKTAAQSPVVRRDFKAGNDIHTYRGSITVGNSQALLISAMAGADNVDPFVVAYYVDDNPASSTAYKIRVAAFNDDATDANRNSWIEWINKTGNSKTIQFVVFGYSSTTRGKGTIITFVGGHIVHNLANREFGGLRVYGAKALPNIEPGCYPTSTLVTETPRFGGGYRGAALVIDTQAMRGGYIEDRPALGPQTLDFPWPLHNPYPSFALLFQTYTGVLPSNWSETPSEYQFTQKDRYSCVN